MTRKRFFSLFPVLTGIALAASAVIEDLHMSPFTVKLDHATAIGRQNGTAVQFLGIPFAQPPVGNLRLRPPVPHSLYTGTINATTFGNQCIQQTFPSISFPSQVPEAAVRFINNVVTVPDIPQSEDCLNLNVIVPVNATPESKLPVAVWIYGGGFQAGSNAVQPGEVVVARSIEIGHPIIYVAMNYRLSAFGFLGGKEVKEAGIGNLGLLDQREALKWVQRHISAFGGDPTKVMIWGQSAGAISVIHHMLANDGNNEGLFRAGFLESGNAPPSGLIDNQYLQITYYGIVQNTGCSGSNDTVQCLREVPAPVLKAAMDKTPSFLSFQQVNTPWFPRADGRSVAEPPEHQLLGGRIANVPVVAGNDEDEGTAFSFPTLNLTTDADFLDYLATNFYKNTSREALSEILKLYPSDPSAGAPFGTGDAFAYSPQYKRISAFQGDFIEQAPRRLLTRHLSGTQPVFGFLGQINKVDGLGAAHGTELTNIYAGGDMGDYLIRFAATLDPNGDGAVRWPRYTKASPQLLTFNDGKPSLNITLDTYRGPQMELLTRLSLADPI